jgi:bifunctional non-homologous end joining protein LigD
LLREHLKHADPAIIYSDHMTGADGEAMFRHACRLGLEGIVSKRAASRYWSGRCASWVKVKNPGYERAVSCSMALSARN